MLAPSLAMQINGKRHKNPNNIIIFEIVAGNWLLYSRRDPATTLICCHYPCPILVFQGDFTHPVASKCKTVFLFYAFFFFL